MRTSHNATTAVGTGPNKNYGLAECYGRIIAIVASVVGSVIVTTVALMIVLYIRKRRYTTKKKSSLHFKYSTVEKATGYWDESNKLAQGGFGTVYKGVLADGREIAVKRLFFNYKFNAADLYNEVNIISSVEHKNLVSGYMAPEYLAHGHLTEKADVYSFGILILEVFTGMQSNRSKITEYADSLLSTVWKHFKQGTVEEIFDPNLMMHIYPNIDYQKDVIKVVHIGLLCTQEASSLRPSMSAALKMLAKDDGPLPTPSNPPFINELTMELNDSTQRSLDNCDGIDSSSVATVSHSGFYLR
ncbi:hypothetical protein L1987_79512 [Smallanthus sonchifolius]|uniref:Uncharacterized protein n=1 Tax=Smallanthus sonchifolius TaxID=185202 RepID=A0ACB8ZEV0_9ASTR|nr:hypothetical protein L1987_79512 [Smallanthus sonchifolius]